MQTTGPVEWELGEWVLLSAACGAGGLDVGREFQRRRERLIPVGESDAERFCDVDCGFEAVVERASGADGEEG